MSTTPTMTTTSSISTKTPPPTTTTTPMSSLSPSLSSDDPVTTRPRLNIPFGYRLMLFCGLSFTTGFGLGSAVGGTAASLRYRAENAHRLPSSAVGWYLYQKSKRYHAFVGGTKSGVRTGLQTTGWGALYVVVEEAFDRCKGYKDFTSSAGAALTMAGLFSAVYHRGDVFTSARTARIALVGGTAVGLVQDALGWARGEVPPYVGWVRRRVGGGRERGYDDDSNGTTGLLGEGDKI